MRHDASDLRLAAALLTLGIHPREVGRPDLAIYTDDTSRQPITRAERERHKGKKKETKRSQRRNRR